MHTMNMTNNHSEEAQKKQRKVLAKAMETVTSQYGGIQWFDAVIREAGQLASKWGSPPGDSGVTDELADGKPCYARMFLRLVLTVDMSLRRASYPCKGELPPHVVDLLSAKSPPLAKEAPPYAATVNPTDMVSWTELYTMFGTDKPFSGEWTDAHEHLRPREGDTEPLTPEDDAELGSLYDNQNLESSFTSWELLV